MLLAVAAMTTVVAADEKPDEFVVVGRYPGPPLWRVSNGAHDLWIFGTLYVVPKDMTWDSANVERVIGAADALLLPPGVSVRPPNPLKIIGYYRQGRRLSRNAEDATLADVLPADLYRRYAALRDQYLSDEDVDKLERQRPVIVSLRLYGAALDATGLTSGEDIQKAIVKIARRADVERVETEIKAAIPDMLDGYAQLSREAELECFTTIVASIETDLAPRAARARAWAGGDIAALRAFDYPDIRADCLNFMSTAENWSKIIEDSDAQWLAAAEQALGANTSTFATLDIGSLLASDGLLAQLRERGYEVREPR